MLGIYTGRPSDRGLAVERKMYGNDFAFIPDIKDFAQVVGMYLHKQIIKNIT